MSHLPTRQFFQGMNGQGMSTTTNFVTPSSTVKNDDPKPTEILVVFFLIHNDRHRSSAFRASFPRPTVWNAVFFCSCMVATDDFSKPLPPPMIFTTNPQLSGCRLCSSKLSPFLTPIILPCHSLATSTPKRGERPKTAWLSQCPVLHSRTETPPGLQQKILTSRGWPTGGSPSKQSPPHRPRGLE